MDDMLPADFLEQIDLFDDVALELADVIHMLLVLSTDGRAFRPDRAPQSASSFWYVVPTRGCRSFLKSEFLLPGTWPLIGMAHGPASKTDSPEAELIVSVNRQTSCQKI
jgi:hypothetical protein